MCLSFELDMCLAGVTIGERVYVYILCLALGRLGNG
jgi:hypothetical protein